MSFRPLLFCLSALALLAAAPLRAQVAEGAELVMLDPKKLVNEVAINPMVSTTITFPEKITLMTGFGLVNDSGAAQQLAQSPVAVVHYENVLPDTLVVRLVKAGEPCHATIRTARYIHLLRFIPSDQANLAVIVPPPVERNAAVQVSPEKVVKNRINFNTDELVGLLGKARNRKALQPLNPGLFAGWEERNGLDMTVSQNGLITTIYEIQRQPSKDAMVFRCWITNGGTEPYEFEPSGVKIRVGSRSYNTQLVDCSGMVQPGQKVPLDVVLQGGPAGGREGLSINQDFRIELPEPGRTQISTALFGDAGDDGSSK